MGEPVVTQPKLDVGGASTERRSTVISTDQIGQTLEIQVDAIL